jgi:hypothetical protein
MVRVPLSFFRFDRRYVFSCGGEILVGLTAEVSLVANGGTLCRRTRGGSDGSGTGGLYASISTIIGDDDPILHLTVNC